MTIPSCDQLISLNALYAFVGGLLCAQAVPPLWRWLRQGAAVRS